MTVSIIETYASGADANPPARGQDGGYEHDANSGLRGSERRFAPDTFHGSPARSGEVGAPPAPLPVGVFNLLLPRRNFAGSAIGGIPETQEMLNFCGERGIIPELEMIKMDYINEAYERRLKQEGKYRFALDMASLKG
jgi:hypothetical protein